MGHIDVDTSYSPPIAAVAAARPDALRSMSDAPAAVRVVFMGPTRREAGLDEIAAAPLFGAVARAPGQTERSAVGDAGAAPDAFGTPEPVSPAELNDAVIAAHEQRIALLRERITSLCAAAGPTTMLDALRERLRRAEAARLLAGVRARRALSNGGGGPAIGCRTGRTMLASAGSEPWRHPGTAQRRRALDVAPARISLHYAATTPRKWRQGGWTTVVANRATWPSVPVLAQRARVRAVAVAFPVHRQQVRRGMLDHATASLLARARRSLTLARQALAEPAPARRMPAGLWRWDGSETWLLTPGRTTTS